MDRSTSITLALIAIVTTLATPADAQTTLLVDFDTSLDATHAAGNSKARKANTLPAGQLRRVPGRTGMGLHIAHDAPALAVSYDAGKNFSPEQGTLEFFFKPDWDFSTKDGDRYLTANLFTTAGDPTGFRLNRNQYNWLSFYYQLSYKTKGRVSTQISPNSKLLEKDKWTHLAVSWDRHEARMFIDGNLVAVSDEWNIPGSHGRLVIGSKPYGKGNAAGGTFDDVRISADTRYINSFTVPEGALKVEKAAPPPPDIDGKTLSVESLWIPTGDRIDRCLGTVIVTCRFNTPPTDGVVLFDASRLVLDRQHPQARDRRTGMRLIINDKAQLEWQCLESGQVLSSVKSRRLNFKSGQRYKLGVSWGGGVKLYLNGETIREKRDTPIPSSLSKYLFFGADSQNQGALDGVIEGVSLRRWDKPEQ